MKNKLLKLLLIAQTIIILVYTIMAFKNEGAGLLAIFLSDIRSFTWNGQFNLDFSAYLLLSGLWIMWRNKCNPFSILVGLTASILGIIVFAPYLLYLLWKEQGDLRKVMIGSR
ncbi:MAG: hypothetical protein JNM21_13760 [Taibaiella sp.]|nr:hypothetical protein [Taibaiella sp.]